MEDTSRSETQVQQTLSSQSSAFVKKSCRKLNALCSSCRSVVLLSAPLGAVLSAEGSLLPGPELPGADEQRRPPAASSALPPRRNQGAAAGPAVLHHPGAVSITVLTRTFAHTVCPSQPSHMVSVVVTRSPVDGRLFLAYPHDSGALSQSFDKLQLLDDGGSDLVSVICLDYYLCN